MGLRAPVRCSLSTAAAVAAFAVLLGPPLRAVEAGPPRGSLPRFTSEYDLERCTFANADLGGEGNPLFSLAVGRRLVLEGEQDGVQLRVEVTVLDKTETISFVTMDGVPLTVETRVVEEREFENGSLVEISENWFARCVETSDVFYFGETVAGAGGAWRAGEDGALPGLIMPGTFLLGSRYFQELAPDVALDRARHMVMGTEITVPAGTFTGCAGIRETTPLEPGEVSVKFYCPGVGLVVDDAVRLVQIDE